MNKIITIGRQYGSAGHEIGEKVADKLGIPFYDAQLLDRASAESGICKEVFKNHDERPTNSFLYSLVMDTYSYGYSSSFIKDMPLNQKVFLAQYDAIKNIAKEGPCVIIGRCADYVLEDDDNLFSVFIHAPLESRIQRIARMYDLTDSKAKDRILKTDKKRASYYNYYSNKDWGLCDSYNLSIDSSVYGVDACVDMIIKAASIDKTGNI